jgi:hypothetical protein
VKRALFALVLFPSLASADEPTETAALDGEPTEDGIEMISNDPAALATPATSAADARRKTPWLRPFAAVVAGLEIESLTTTRPDDDREGRAVTLAMSRFGIRAGIARGITLESEFEANAGPHGTSAWEGQAALSVRNQLIRIEHRALTVDAGRITDPASVDFYSVNVADQLLTDGYTRAPLLSSGFNRGNGVAARYALGPVTTGLSINAANPISTTSSLVVGGTFPPFARFYFAPYQYVGRDAANFPADEYHFVMVTPSATLHAGPLQVQGALQMFQVNTNTSSSMDQHIDGLNARVGAALTLGRVRPFVNASIVQNEVVDPDDGTRLSGDVFTGVTASAGADVVVHEKVGVGGQAAWVHDHQAGRALADQYFFNLGATYWLAHKTALALRAALYRRGEHDEMGNTVTDGEQSLFFTIRTEI